MDSKSLTCLDYIATKTQSNSKSSNYKNKYNLKSSKLETNPFFPTFHSKYMSIEFALDSIECLLAIGCKSRFLKKMIDRISHKMKFILPLISNYFDPRCYINENYYKNFNFDRELNWNSYRSQTKNYINEQFLSSETSKTNTLRQTPMIKTDDITPYRLLERYIHFKKSSVSKTKIVKKNVRANKNKKIDDEFSTYTHFLFINLPQPIKNTHITIRRDTNRTITKNELRLIAKKLDLSYSEFLERAKTMGITLANE